MSAELAQVQDKLKEILEEMIDDLELDYEGELGPETLLIADLGFASVDFIHLIVEIETSFGKKMGFHDLIMPDGKYIEDLALAPMAQFIQRRLEGEALTEEPATASDPADAPIESDLSQPRITEADYARFCALMPSGETWGAIPPFASRNPRMVFLLSSSRSGSTLVRVMLAGNPKLFVPPELHLLTYADLQRRHAALNNPENAHLLTGTVRAMMQIRGIEPEAASAFMAECERQGMSTHDFFQIMQSELGDRLLVDKSPTYPMRREFLERAETEFDEPLYLHLVRHPCGMIKSFEDGKMDQLIPFMRSSDFSRRQLGELFWLMTNRNVSGFLQGVPTERQLRMQYERIVREPETAMRDVCDFLAVPYEPAMLDPYGDPRERMTDGLQSASEFSGDLKFHLHAGVDADAAERWRKSLSESILGQPTRELAESYGYQLRT